MCVKVKWVLCYFVIVSRPVAYAEYSKPFKNTMSDRRHLLLLTLNLLSCFAWVSNFKLQSNTVMALGHQFLTISHFKACLKIETTTPLWMRLHHCIEMYAVDQTMYLLTARWWPKITQIQQAPRLLSINVQMCSQEQQPFFKQLKY